MTTRAPAAPGSSRPPAPTPEEIRGQLLRMFRHRAFSRSPRLQRFLEFVVETTLADRAHELKEFTVAVHAFDKNESFDPRIDPIVRVEAGRLRQRIDEYYQDNPGDQILIRLRKRGYRPIMRWMKPADRIDGSQGVASTALGGQRRPQRRATIAIIEFENLTQNPSHAQISRAIPERVMTLLPERTDLRPAGTTLASSNAGFPRADFLLKGSVQWSGRRIRVIAHVLRTADGLQLWSDTFDRRVRDDLFELEDDIAGAIASGLRVD